MNFRATATKFAKPEARRRPNPALSWRWVCASLLLSCLGGCSRWNIRDAWPWDDKQQAQVPDRVLPMWTDTVLYQPGQRGVRGFGARIYFYNREQKEPVEVDGQLIVYAFDATKQQGGIPVPEKKYVFTADQLPRHHSKTDMGHSYSVWLPWDEIGGPSRHVTLITRFEGRESGVAVSDPVHKMLPGVPRAQELAADGSTPAAAGTSSVQAASFQSAPPTDSAAHPESITIDVTPEFARRLAPETANNTAPAAPVPTGRAVAPQTPASRSSQTVAPAVTAPSAVEPTTDPALLNDPPALEAGAATATLPYHQRLATHFARPRYPARNSSESPPDPAPLRKEPYRARWLSGLPPTPRPRFQ